MCVCTFIGGLGGGGVDVGGFINRAVAVIELFFLSILKIAELQLSVMYFRTL